MVMIDGKEYHKKEMLLKNAKYNSTLIHYIFLEEELEATKNSLKKYARIIKRLAKED